MSLEPAMQEGGLQAWLRLSIHMATFSGLKVSKDVDKGRAAGVSDHVWKIEEIVALLA